MSPVEFAGAEKSAELINKLGSEFAVIPNPAYIHPPFELYPLAPHPKLPLDGLRAVVCDMDGTVTTTEALCLHSLENMIRVITSNLREGEWTGLSAEDHPHVIGNSTTRHVEYLVETYGSGIKLTAFFRGLLEACTWTCRYGHDPLRAGEARTAASHLGIRDSLERILEHHLTDDAQDGIRAISGLSKTCLGKHPCGDDELDSVDLVRGAIEIYYARYHQILDRISKGDAGDLAAKILSTPGRHLIEPMPGVELFLAMIRGWLDPSNAGRMFDHCVDEGWYPVEDVICTRNRFIAAAGCFQSAPVSAAIVTSSIAYEAGVVLGDLFSVLQSRVENWPVDDAVIERARDGFRSPQQYYDGIITASDSSEIRLKPHRDLYSIALHRLGLQPSEFGRVLALEDSESGVIAIRAAGIGLCVAVPFAETSGHDLSAAMQINHGGLPQVMFDDLFFLNV
jgi:phosphoglycolate phosphatase-like HAD superfamily hydrolase